MQQVVLAIVQVILSGLTSGVFIFFLNRRNRRREIKTELIGKILGFSYQLSEKSNNNSDIARYLNEAYIVFHDSEKVINSLVAFKTELLYNKNFSEDLYANCLKEMIRNVRFKYIDGTEEFIRAPFQ